MSGKKKKTGVVKELIPFISGSIFIFLVLIMAAKGHAGSKAACLFYRFHFENEPVMKLKYIVAQIPAGSSGAER